MKFSVLVREVQNYVRMQDADSRFNIKIFINEAIQEFIRSDEWEKLIFTKKFTTDDSKKYAISTTILTPGTDPIFESELSLIDEGVINDLTPLSQTQVSTPFAELQKMGYALYIKQVQKGGKYAILGDDLHVTGTTRELTFSYSGPGTPYPLTQDDDEPQVLISYSDIIRHWAAWKFLDWLGDDKSTQSEFSRLQAMLGSLKQKEQRVRKNGKIKFVGIHNR